MGTSIKKDMRKRVKKYIDTADDTTVKMIHAILKIQRRETDTQDEAEFDENDRRIAEYESGKITPIRLTIEELGDRARELYKTRILQKNE